MFLKRLGVVVFLIVAVGASTFAGGRVGVLLLAHGHEEAWNRQVTEMARQLPYPSVEVALGMAHRNTIAEAVERLNRQGVDRIVAVPLFVSSHSSIFDATAYLLGLRAEAPPELELFNRMSHGLQKPAGHKGHDGRSEAPLDLSPIPSSSPVLMTGALDDHPLVGEILGSRAASISRNPGQEIVILVAHGPTTERSNRQWLEKLAQLANQIARTGGYRAVHSVTLMDDAPAALRDQMTAQLRRLVADAGTSGTALVVPVLLSRGGIEPKIRQRLEGLPYRMPETFLLPDPRIGSWICLQVEEALKKSERIDGGIR